MDYIWPHCVLPFRIPNVITMNHVWAIESLHRSWQREEQESESVGKRKAKIQEVLGRFAEPRDKKLKEWLRANFDMRTSQPSNSGS